MRIGNSKYKMRVVGIGTTMTLGMIGLMLVCPVVGSEVEAAEPSDSIMAQTAVNVNPVISIGLADSRLEIDLTPKSTGSFDQTSTTLTVATNNLHGYKIFMQSSNDGKLVNVDSTVHASINPLGADDLDETGFGSNTWGYALTNTNEEATTYSAVPSSTTAVKNVDVASVSNADNYNLSLAAKVDTSLPAGSYAGAIILSAIANPIEITSINQLFYMQDMTPEICANTALDTTKQLIDTRDGKSYWVAKLKDGNCWMTQNLALDLTAGETLTADSTDLANASDKQWVVPKSTNREISALTADGNYNESWNLGKYVYTVPRKLVRCNESSDLSKCSNFVNVADWHDTFISTQGTWDDENTFVSVNAQDQTYDAHYLIGNYYQWNAATAGTGVATNTPNAGNTAAETDPSKLVNATGSICPKGWKLPVSGANLAVDEGWPFDLEDSFYKLFRAYNWPETGSSTTNGSLSWSRWIKSENREVATTSLRDLNSTIAPFSNPFFFVLTGRIYNNVLYGLGMQDMIWSSTVRPNKTSVFVLILSDIGLSPSSIEFINEGGSIRCLAR